MKMLKSKLYQLKLEEQEQEMAEIRGEKRHWMGKSDSFLRLSSIFND